MKKKSVKSVKNKKKFYCERCNYTASQKSHYKKHLNTKKHKRITGENVEKDVKKVLKSVNIMYTCNICNKQYKDRSGLRYHKKNARCYKSTNESNINETKLDDLTKQMTKLTSSITEAVDSGMLGTKNVITNNNISINFFLDKYCNNAQSLQDFVENISFQLKDIVNGNQMIDNFISKKVLKNLEDIPITERPIHCTDQKRRNFMVKDKNEGWVKDSVDTNGSFYTHVNQIHSKAYIDFYTEYDKKHPLPHGTDDETFKCEMASKLLNYDKRNLVNDIAKTSDIRNVVGPAGITVEDVNKVNQLDNDISHNYHPIEITNKPSSCTTDTGTKTTGKINIGTINLNNVQCDSATLNSSSGTDIDTNIIGIKNNMIDMVKIMNNMVGQI
jgi:hypothetical protein